MSTSNDFYKIIPNILKKQKAFLSDITTKIQFQYRFFQHAHSSRRLYKKTMTEKMKNELEKFRKFHLKIFIKQGRFQNY